MAEQRPIVLINGNLQQLPAGDNLSSHSLIIQNAGIFEQLPVNADYSAYSPIVYIAGNYFELPDGDTLAGVPVEFTGNFDLFEVSSYLVLDLAPAVIYEVSAYLVLEPT